VRAAVLPDLSASQRAGVQDVVQVAWLVVAEHRSTAVVCQQFVCQQFACRVSVQGFYGAVDQAGGDSASGRVLHAAGRVDDSEPEARVEHG